MKKLIGTIDLTPTPTEYARSLILILESGDAKGKEFARQEIIKLVKAAATITPEAWAKEDTPTFQEREACQSQDELK